MHSTNLAAVKKQAARMLKLAKSGKFPSSVSNLAEAQDAAAQLHGYAGWQDLCAKARAVLQPRYTMEMLMEDCHREIALTPADEATVANILSGGVAARGIRGENSLLAEVVAVMSRPSMPANLAVSGEHTDCDYVLLCETGVNSSKGVRIGLADKGVQRGARLVSVCFANGVQKSGFEERVRSLDDLLELVRRAADAAARLPHELPLFEVDDGPTGAVAAALNNDAYDEITLSPDGRLTAVKSLGEYTEEMCMATMAAVRDAMRQQPARILVGSSTDPTALALLEDWRTSEVIRIARIKHNGSTLTIEANDLAETLAGFDDGVGESSKYEVSFGTMTRAEFEALGEFGGF